MGQEERQLIVDRAAGEELLAAVSWYEQKRPGVGRDLLAAVDETLGLIQGFPGIGRLAAPDAKGRQVRKLRVEGFPFAVLYREVPTAILVVAVAHDKRRPGYWRDR